MALVEVLAEALAGERVAELGTVAAQAGAPGMVGAPEPDMVAVQVGAPGMVAALAVERVVAQFWGKVAARGKAGALAVARAGDMEGILDSNAFRHSFPYPYQHC